jgi:hypothetical protein
MKHQPHCEETHTLRHSGISYIELVKLINKQLAPTSYFEIGTYIGSSLECFSCDAICVDPQFRLKDGKWIADRKRTLLFQQTSDDFFRDQNLATYYPIGPDISFLDGNHRAEFLLRDFMNLERFTHSGSLILLHDCLPLNARMAERNVRHGDKSIEGTTWNWWT